MASREITSTGIRPDLVIWAVFGGSSGFSEQLAGWFVRILCGLVALALMGGSLQAEAARFSPPGINQLKEQKGVVVTFSMMPVTSKSSSIKVGEEADVHFKVVDAVSRQPIKGLKPGAWLDIRSSLIPSVDENAGCKAKIQTYLKGLAGVRPLLDLTSYYLLAFNLDASISVIDPLVGVAGKTHSYATIPLRAQAADWAKSQDGKRLYVTLPEANRVAVVDTDRFKVIAEIEAGRRPVRIALQPDERYLWVANDADTETEGGATVIDTRTLKPVGHIGTGSGHHELAFTDDDRLAFVSNRHQGTLSVIDIGRLVKLREIKTGSLPISMIYSKSAQTLYVADGTDGIISVIAGRDPDRIAAIKARPGLGPLSITPDGRWLLAVNSRENLVHVVEIATNQLVQAIPVGKQPYQIAFSDAYAYVRSLDSEHVGMISLTRLGKDAGLQISTFPAGSKPPGAAPDLGIGTSVVPAVGEAAVLVASPADNLVYYYMEGMLAPSGNFRNPGHHVRAIEMIDRSLRETGSGDYKARVRLPVAGIYDVAFLLESPRLIQCFHAEVKPDPQLEATHRAATIDYPDLPANARAGDSVAWRFRLDDPETRQPRTGLSDVRVLYYLAPGIGRTEVPAHEIKAGLYQADLPVRKAGAYYIYVSVPSLQLDYDALPYRNLLVEDRPEAPGDAHATGYQNP